MGEIGVEVIEGAGVTVGVMVCEIGVELIEGAGVTVFDGTGVAGGGNGVVEGINNVGEAGAHAASSKEKQRRKLRYLSMF